MPQPTKEVHSKTKNVQVVKGYVQLPSTYRKLDGTVEKREGGFVPDENGKLFAIGIEGEQFEIVWADDTEKLHETITRLTEGREDGAGR